MLTPVAIPDELPIVATPVFALLHTQPVVVELSVVVPPTHIVVVPVIAFGISPTVTTAVTLQPVGSRVYVILVVPAALPVTVPSVATVPTAVVLLLHVPLPLDVNAVVEPLHTNKLPDIASGNAFTVASRVM